VEPTKYPSMACTPPPNPPRTERNAPIAFAARRQWLFLVVAALLGISALLVPQMDLPPSYHRFADQRGWLGIPNFGNVASNVAYLAAGGRRRRGFGVFDLLPSVNGGDSYGSQAHACTRVASVGSCHDALASGEGCEQANKANPASFIFTAAT
jgi:hypothetical protein